MARQNVPFIALGNRGLISPKTLARVDLDRTRMSAETFNNWIGKTQGALTLRPGTKYVGNTLNDTGAAWVEFVASVDDVALLELVNDTGSGAGVMRVWLGEDAHDLSLLTRPAVDTTVSLTDTGWDDNSTGGRSSEGSNTHAVPVFPYTESNPASYKNATIQVSSQNPLDADGRSHGYGGTVSALFDGSSKFWEDTGYVFGGQFSPSWVSVDFDTGANGNDAIALSSYALSAVNDDYPDVYPLMPSEWRLLAGDYDTGTYATDTGKWTREDAQTGQTNLAYNEKRSFALPGHDTGTVETRRHWRLFFADSPYSRVRIKEIEFSSYSANSQIILNGSQLTLNSTAIGSRAIYQKRVLVSDTGTEHSLDIVVSRGPVSLRVGSTLGDDNYISEASLGTGYHNLAFTPLSDFYITLQSSVAVDRIVESLTIGDSGTVEIATPWVSSNLDDIRYDQSADVVYADCSGVKPKKIERRGTGRSWSVVDYAPNDGPFLVGASSAAQLSVSHFYGNTTLNSDIPVFTANHVGSLVRIFHEKQGGIWPLGQVAARTDAIEVTGLSDTGYSPPADSERAITFSVTGNYKGTVTIQRSADDKDFGFKPISSSLGTASDTGTFTTAIIDRSDNTSIWYRAEMTAHDTGVANVEISYTGGGGKSGIARITGYNTNTDCDIEVLSRFADTGPSSDWQFGYWSGARGYPTAVALHGGRLGHAQGGSVFLSVSDDYESFNSSVTDDDGPIIKTLGSGPVNNIHYLVSLLRLIIGTAGAELAMKSSSLDEPLTPANSAATQFSTQGSANLRALRMDTRAIFVQRSNQRVFMVGANVQGNAFGDYEGLELTLLVPDLLKEGVVSLAVQRQPDTRFHFVLADGTVAILTYEPSEEVIAWSTWSTDGTVEKAMVLPGASEDAVFYQIKRTINGASKRFLEKWAKEAECNGDTGLSWLADCAVSYTDTGRSATLTGFSHLAGENVIVWADDTGQTNAGKDLSPDVAGVQTTYPVDTGAGTITLSEAVHHAVAGLPYAADWKSTKLAYAAQGGTALAQMKRISRIAVILYNTHNSGLHYGSDTGHLQSMPRQIDGDKTVDADKIFETFDQVAFDMDGAHDADARFHLRGKAPRPCTVLAVVPSINTNERV